MLHAAAIPTWKAITTRKGIGECDAGNGNRFSHTRPERLPSLAILESSRRKGGLLLRKDTTVPREAWDCFLHFEMLACWLVIPCLILPVLLCLWILLLLLSSFLPCHDPTFSSSCHHRLCPEEVKTYPPSNRVPTSPFHDAPK
jgi:hypothetical protein